jgi:hypothetical protein
MLKFHLILNIAKKFGVLNLTVIQEAWCSWETFLILLFGLTEFIPSEKHQYYKKDWKLEMYLKILGDTKKLGTGLPRLKLNAFKKLEFRYWPKYQQDFE